MQYNFNIILVLLWQSFGFIARRNRSNYRLRR